MEDSELKKLLRENLEINKDNNRLLRKMRRYSIIGGTLKVLWWAVLIGVPVYLYLTFFQPFLTDATETLREVQSGVESIQSVGRQAQQAPVDLRDFLEGFFGGQ